MVKKRICESATTQVQILMPEHINGMGRLFGGKLVEWIDIVAAVVARRHSNRNVTTVCIDNLQFEAPAHSDDTIVISGMMTYVGRTSMEVKVNTYVEAIDGIRKQINQAYLVLVALDENEKPTEVPGLILETEQEKAEWDAGKKRRELGKNRKKDSY